MHDLKKDYNQGYGNLETHLESGKLPDKNLPTDVFALMPLVVSDDRQYKEESSELKIVQFTDLQPKEIEGIGLIHYCITDCANNNMNLFNVFAGTELFEAGLQVGDRALFGMKGAIRNSKILFFHALENGIPETVLKDTSYTDRIKPYI